MRRHATRRDENMPMLCARKPEDPFALERRLVWLYAMEGKTHVCGYGHVVGTAQRRMDVVW